MENKPTVFLCHAWEDKEPARRLAADLFDAGIKVFFDEWEIRAGDSLRQKIDQGLTSCTHFIALLTPASLGKSWVQTEMDAGFTSKWARCHRRYAACTRRLCRTTRRTSNG